VTTTYPPLRRSDTRVLGTLRIVAGLLWLANLEWKRPPDFGKNLNNGLYKYVDSAIRNPVFDPYTWVVENVIVKQYGLFGWATLLLESTLAALLILGFKTRWAALAGALFTVPIFLSVLYYDKVYEWPWSYYLMAALHLAVFATATNQAFSLDVARREGPAALKRFGTVLGIGALIVGVAGLWTARSVDFTGRRGAMLGWANGELKFLWFNPLSALLTMAVAGVALLGLRTARREVVWVAAASSAVMAAYVALVWRYRSGDWTGGVLGATGPNLAFWGMLALGFAVCANGLAKRDTPAS
jgi:uncharacterized membrane protein YphA (DoxX/SURF4 family)